MKKVFIIVTLILTLPWLALAQQVSDANGHTASEEAAGKVVWEKLQAKQVQCTALTDDDFGVLGEYFMGQMMGSSHEAMNNMMIQMMGETGEEQMHVVMGKRLSGCDTAAAFPSSGTGFMPMMGMMGMFAPSGTGGSGIGMMGGFPKTAWGANSMMTPFGGWSWFGWLLMILFWVFLVVLMIALIRWLLKPNQSSKKGSALEILNERLAKGEIAEEEYQRLKNKLTN